MFALLASFGAGPSFEVGLGLVLLLLFELDFELFELPFEAQVGEDGRSTFADECDCFLEAPGVLFHYVGADEGRGLHRGGYTLEMPAAQWTRRLPLLIYF